MQHTESARGATPHATDHRFLAEAGDCGRRVAAFDWSTTPLGPIAGWPPVLRTAAAIVLRSPAAMALLWGADGTMIYNDAYAVIAGDRHPAALGERVCNVWPEAADFNGAVLRQVLAGAALTWRDQPFVLQRAGVPVQTWFTLDYSPVIDDAGAPAGVMAVVVETTQQTQSEARLRESGARLRRAQEAGGIGAFTIDLSTNVITGTSEFFRLFGLPENAALPTAAFEALVLAEDAQRRSDARTHGTPAAPLDVEYRIRRADDGAVRWIARRAEYERDEHGRALRMVGIVQDVSERKAAQAALEESAAQFRAFAQAMPNHAWTARPDGLLDWFNDRVYEYSGAAAGELDGERWAAIVHPDDIDQAARLWRASVATGVDYETEFRIRRHDGAQRWHLVRALPLHSAAGAIGRWVGTNTDIHERKLAEAESARGRDRIWKLSQELMLVCDFGGVIAAVNPAATRMLGWEAEEMVGKRLADFIHPDDQQRTADEVGKLARGVHTLAFENRYRGRDASYRVLDWTASPDGGFIHAVARDVTRERLAEEAMRQSQKLEAVGQLTGGVAHDFNNLLAIIRTSIDILRLPNLPDERRQRFMGSIANAVTRGAKLTGQLLAFARRQALQPVAFDAAANVEAVSDMVATLMGSRISVAVEPAPGPCIVVADPSQFDTAIINMAVNARDAMDGAGELLLRVRNVAEIPALRSQPAVPGEFVAISLRDTGTGIEPALLARIFEPFYTTKAVGLGTGLGLSQVFGFAKQSGGDILVESRLGAGSTFTLYLPRAAAREASAAPAEDVPVAGHGHGAAILVVEDNLDVASSVQHILEELGYAPIVVHGAEAALAALDASRFAAVFSDVVMAGMDGIRLGQEIRRRHPTLPIVLTSGYSEVLANDVKHGFELLPKPYSLDALSRVLRRAVEHDVAAERRTPAIAGLGHLARDHGLTQEQRRVAELEAMLVLDSEEEAAYDELTRLAATICETPIALISLVDRDRQWFKSRVGLRARETPREFAFCAHAIERPEEVMVVSDATLDARFVDNPLVTGDPNIRFYAGAPLVTAAGHALGTLCVIDYESRRIEPEKLALLKLLAGEVIRKLEARRAELMASFSQSAGGAG